MAELQPRSGALITIRSSEDLEQPLDKPLPQQLRLQEKQYRTFHVRPRQKSRLLTVPAPNAAELHVSVADNNLAMMGINNFADANVVQRFAWIRPSIAPQGHPELLNPVMYKLWEIYFGENPLQGTKEVFGKGTGLIEVEFLGHPDEMLIDVMAAQAAEYQPELCIHYPNPDGTSRQNTFNRVVVKTSPVMPVVVAHEWYDRKARCRHPYEYNADAMYFLELQRRDNTQEDKREITHRQIPSALRIGVAIQDSIEHKLRVYHSVWRDIEHTTDIDQKHRILSQHLNALHELSMLAFSNEKITVADVDHRELATENGIDFDELFDDEVAQLTELLQTRERVIEKDTSAILTTPITVAI